MSNAASPFDPPNAYQVRAILALESFLKSNADAELRENLVTRKVLLEVAAGRAETPLERLVDLSTDEGVHPALKRVAIEMIARRLANQGSAAERRRRVEQLLAAGARGRTGKPGAGSDACLRGRFRTTMRAPVGSECSGPEDASTDWLDTGRVH